KRSVWDGPDGTGESSPLGSRRRVRTSCRYPDLTANSTGGGFAFCGFAALGTAAQFHLAARAEVGGAAGDDDPLDDAVAVARARLALAGVDEEALLHPALLATPVAIVVDRGA